VDLQEDAYNRVVAIGDLHGHLEPLKEMLRRIDPKPSDSLLFIGDYIDRGPDSKDLVQELIDLRFSLQNLFFLKGNHEDMLLGSLGFPALVTDLDTWLYNGGAATLQSYGAGTGEIDHALSIRDDAERASFLRNLLPLAHLDFFLNLEMYVESEHFFFCHGGIDPGKSVEEGKGSIYQLLWMREHLYADEPVWEKTVVCGHTPLRNPLLSPKLVAIDTGLHYFGTLTAVEVLSREVFQVSW
jgi:serine/threonine protein phosphatase 1